MTLAKLEKNMYVDENELCDKNSQIGMYEVVAKKKIWQTKICELPIC